MRLEVFPEGELLREAQALGDFFDLEVLLAKERFGLDNGEG